MRLNSINNIIINQYLIIEEDVCKLSSKDKKYIAKLWDGTRIFLVDGSHVRDNVNVAFFGGTHPKYEDCKTAKEIWIEKGKSGSEESKILVHEITEYILMKFCNMSYNKAHDIANSVENAVRTMARY